MNELEAIYYFTFTLEIYILLGQHFRPLTFRQSEHLKGQLGSPVSDGCRMMDDGRQSRSSPIRAECRRYKARG